VKVAVLGATGFIGRALVPVLEDLADVVAVSRSGPVRADITNAEEVGRVLEGVDVVYYLVHSLGTSDFADRDRRGATIIARAAEGAGVDQMVYLGGLAPDDAELSEHLRSRHETEAVLRSGRVPVTAIGSAVVVGRGSAAFETIVALVDRLPAMVCPRWVSTPTQPIALDDIVGYLASVCGLDAALDQSYQAGGPEVLTYRAMIEQIARIRGRTPRIVEIPVLSPRLSSYWLEIVTPVNAATARPLIDGLRVPTVVTDSRLQELVPQDLTPFAQAAEAALAGR
jgi:uncharacterized protein YbjT (DUF2867 family)